MVKAAALIGFPFRRIGRPKGLKLTPADLLRLQTATGRFHQIARRRLAELDAEAVQSAHEAMADLGVDGLVPCRNAGLGTGGAPG
jgi:hypothetical protein